MSEIMVLGVQVKPVPGRDATEPHETLYLMNCNINVACCTPQAHSSHIAVSCLNSLHGAPKCPQHLLIISL